MKTAIVILNWNTRELLDRFLPSLLQSVEGKDAEVIVADNASTDGSRELLSDRFPQVRTIGLDNNYGFTGGYNRALGELSGSKYFVLINSDIEVNAGWLEPLVEWMDTHPQCGACAPKILAWKDRDRFEYAGAAGGFVDLLGIPYCRGRILGLTEKDSGQYDTPCRVLWGSGACLMVRADIWKQMGGLDERFFAHMEEIDLCWRMQLSGHEVWSVPASKVWHVGGATLAAGSPKKIELNFRNGLLMLENCLPGTVGPCVSRIVLILRMIIDRLIQVGYFISGRSDAARAVSHAHRAFRQLRKGIGPVSGTAGKVNGTGPNSRTAGKVNGTGPNSRTAGKVAGYGGLVFFKYIRRKFSHAS